MSVNVNSPRREETMNISQMNKEYEYIFEEEEEESLNKEKEENNLFTKLLLTKSFYFDTIKR